MPASSVILFGLLVGNLTPALAADPGLHRFTFQEPHMGTQFRIILYAPDEILARKAAVEAFQRIATLDRIMSDYRPASELMQLCQKSGGTPVRVSEELFFVLEKAQEVSQLSGGVFDVTIGPVVRIWRRARKIHELPNPEELAKARSLVGYANVRLDKKNQTVQLLKAGMKLDLGGIAKGYAADEALGVLKKKGITRALVAAGGDIAVGDRPPDAPGWSIGIAPLENPDQKPSRYLILENAAVSTSGDAEQYVEIKGIRYSHIVDPRTGIGLIGRQSATVVAPRGILADSLTKVVSILEPEKSLPIIDGIEGSAALFIRKTDKGEEIFTSKHFAKIPQKNSKD
ncbi:MAG TPA: FAD:protein FMN transferase [Gemmataceae bacterium]|jgi:thiamine biosynthesis lipoprotein|nr:FAD:protein FMN transferase [Gemmataceae bacterium]